MSVYESLRLHTTEQSYIFESTTSGYGSSNNGCLVIARSGDGAVRYEEQRPAALGASQAPRTIYGILGLIRLRVHKYLILITNRKRIGRLGTHDIFQITSTEIIPLSPLGKTVKDADETRYLGLLRAHLGTGPFYYSYEGDVTNSVQRVAGQEKENKGMAALALWERADERFFWNRYLQSDLIDARSEYKQLDHFILPVMYGFFEIRATTVHGAPLTFVLISRRSRFRAGTRYFTRGIDTEGHASNFNETEQIIIVNQGEKERRLSYVQTRGSIPLFWGEVNDLKYRPKLKLYGGIEHNLDPARLHFEEQKRIYGEQFLVNLVNQKGHELPVKNAYEDLVHNLNDPEIHYTYFDFHHECSGMRWHRVQLLLDALEPGLGEQGWTDVGDGTQLLRTQKSVVRTNCMDCLDRTNVVQSTLARHVLTLQLRSISLLAPGQEPWTDAGFELMFRGVWADNANCVSKSYSGTGALKTDFTRTGRRTKMGAWNDFWNSVTRYFMNNYLDGPRQDAYDLFLGVYKPHENPSTTPFLDSRPLLTQSAPYILISALIMLLCALVLPRDEEAWIPLSWFVWVWVGALVWSGRYVMGHGVLYVSWPRLCVPEWVDMEVGGGVNSESVGQKGMGGRGFLEGLQGREDVEVARKRQE
ncbi:Phosphoinositide phosphatase sac1 [Saitoella coloradoensis]